MQDMYAKLEFKLKQNGDTWVFFQSREIGIDVGPSEFHDDGDIGTIDKLGAGKPITLQEACSLALSSIRKRPEIDPEYFIMELVALGATVEGWSDGDGEKGYPDAGTRMVEASASLEQTALLEAGAQNGHFGCEDQGQ